MRPWAPNRLDKDPDPHYRDPKPRFVPTTFFHSAPCEKIPLNSWDKVSYYAPARRKGAISVAFVRPSVRLSVRASVAYIANNSRTQRPSVPKFGRKVPHLRCDSHTSFKVKRSKVRVRSGRGHTVSAEPGGHTGC